MQKRLYKFLAVFLFLVALIFIFPAHAQPPPAGGGGDPPCWPPPCIPITEGIGFLIAAGLAYGGKKLWGKRKH